MAILITESGKSIFAFAQLSVSANNPKYKIEKSIKGKIDFEINREEIARKALKQMAELIKKENNLAFF